MEAGVCSRFEGEEWKVESARLRVTPEKGGTGPGRWAATGVASAIFFNRYHRSRTQSVEVPRRFSHTTVISRSSAEPRADMTSQSATSAQSEQGPRRMTTRGTNANRHPGLPDLARWNPDDPQRLPTPPKEHRERVQQQKKEADKAKASARAKKMAALERAAQKLEKMRQEDRLNDDLRREPPPPPSKLAPSRAVGGSRQMSRRIQGEVYCLFTAHPLRSYARTGHTTNVPAERTEPVEDPVPAMIDSDHGEEEEGMGSIRLTVLPSKLIARVLGTSLVLEEPGDDATTMIAGAADAELGEPEDTGELDELHGDGSDADSEYDPGDACDEEEEGEDLMDIEDEREVPSRKPRGKVKQLRRVDVIAAVGAQVASPVARKRKDVSSVEEAQPCVLSLCSLYTTPPF